MKKTVALMDKFICLAGGETLPASSLKGDWVEQMVADGVLLIAENGAYPPTLNGLIHPQLLLKWP